MPPTNRHRVHPEIRRRAIEFRHPLTPAENRLWQAVRDRQLNGYKIRRQVPFGPYIADFCCIEKSLIIEIDGSSHANRAEYDAIRTAYLEALGYRLLRFPNEQIFQNLNSVLNAITLFQTK